MSSSLIVVESPAKVKTIKKFLGGDYQVMASVGHVKDLPKSALGIDIEKSFTPTYQVMDAKKKVLSEIRKASEHSDKIYLAPDPDREGEAIAWHIAEEVGLGKKPIYRVLFNDLTKPTVVAALANPTQLDFNKYEAQQTRRILDRLVGYQISPILWEKVQRGLSAGRVQSVAVRIICDREEEIRRFVSEEYWNLTAVLSATSPQPFEARLIKIEGRKAKLGNEADVKALLETLANSAYLARKIEQKEVKKQAPPPFTTSKLQQEASRWFRFPAKKTMSVAQKLYEGIDLGKEGSVGLITYMRTDSVRISDDALKAVRKYIGENYAPEYLPAKARVFKTSERAQDAHEAIRPSSMDYRPQDIRSHLTDEQFKLYQLIWNRFVASQMNPVISAQTIIDIEAAHCLFRAQGSTPVFPGYSILYSEKKEESPDDENGVDEKTLPKVTEGESLKLQSLNPEQKFTQPPPRFTEASLVRELEENGIGRPSTYATILSTIQERNYVALQEAKFHPTELGMLINELLVKNFPRILDIEFTASLETQLDQIEEGAQKRQTALQHFYDTFKGELDLAKSQMRNVKKLAEPTDLVCDKCGKPMVKKWGKNGMFLACSGYPACKNTSDLGGKDQAPVPETDIPCSLCGRKMVVKKGKFGSFLGCSAYPECKNIQNFTLDETGAIKIAAPPAGEEMICEKCGAKMTKKRGKFGYFWGCSGYPACDHIVKIQRGASTEAKAKAPVEVAPDVVCPKCGREMIIRSGRFGKFLGCAAYPACKTIVNLKKGTATEKKVEKLA
jgi:DNA topoisomerase-1